ncbi:sugar-binding transcriptional regulator [uncultured Cedecea sp.]|uniref:sugar-binding transcriptional regulator n=1 Tax=uncultured Cedecea sp. TaxID=988762 RepID=UPI0026386805|nr:sugar-binding transcriptional regulator [uncultured Cedecea sp.]
MMEYPINQQVHDKVADVPVEFDGNPLIWAAWLYYEEGMTQQAIADLLHVSRTSVVKMLQAARDEGIVSISVAPQHLGAVRGARELKARYQLETVIVVPDDGGVGQDYERIGRAAGRYLASVIKPEDILGVCWGKTVLAMSETVPEMTLPNLTIVQAAGSAMGAYESSTERCTANIAVRLHARSVNLHAPGIVSSYALKEALMAEKSIKEKFSLLHSCSKIVFGMADLGSQSMAFASGYLEREDAQPYLHNGAIGMAAGRFFDASGQAVLGELDNKMIGITLEKLTQIPERICIAGGKDKVAALHALLSGGNATVLVTDESTALMLLQQP